MHLMSILHPYHSVTLKWQTTMISIQMLCTNQLLKLPDFSYDSTLSLRKSPKTWKYLEEQYRLHTMQQWYVDPSGLSKMKPEGRSPSPTPVQEIWAESLDQSYIRSILVSFHRSVSSFAYIMRTAFLVRTSHFVDIKNIIIDK